MPLIGLVSVQDASRDVRAFQQISTTESRWIFDREHWLRIAVAALIVYCSIFNLLLCFVNTNIFPTNATTAALAELVVISACIGIITLTRSGDRSLFFITIIAMGANFSVLFFTRGIDPKPVRDLLIPIVFFTMGTIIHSKTFSSRIVSFLIILTLLVGLIEYLFPEFYVYYFNILRFFINKGVTPEEAADFIKSGLNINGERPAGQGRELFGFLLSTHRSSSIFLEPVTTGNFAAICGAWILSSTLRATWKFCAFCCCAAIIILADGRFGMLLLLSALTIYLIKPLHRPAAWVWLPFGVCTLLILYPIILEVREFPNDFLGRIAYAGHLFPTIDIYEWFGLTASRIYFDAGYAYAITQFGVILSVFMWFLFSYVACTRAPRSFFVSYVMFFVCISLMISNSMWSIKASALMWFLAGQEVWPIAKPCAQSADERSLRALHP